MTVRPIREDYQTFYETAPVPFLVLAPDPPRFTILAVSDAYLSATKTTREIVGRGIFEVFPDDPDDPASTGGPARASFERVLDSRAPDAMAVQKHSIPRPQSEGGGFEEKYWSPVNTPVLGSSGEVLFIHHRVEDVTDFIRQRQGGPAAEAVFEMRTRAVATEADIVRRSRELQEANQQLRIVNERLMAAEPLLASERRLRALADSMPQLAWTAQPDGYITWYNRRWYEYTGSTPEQMEGWGWQAVHDPATLPDVLRRWKVSIATGTAFEMEFPLRGADGKFRHFLTRVFPLKDEGGNVLQWFGTNTDVTELVNAQETLSVVTRLYAVLSRVNEAIVRTRDEQSLYEAVCRIVAEDGGFPLVWVGLTSGREVQPAASSGRAIEYLGSIKVETEGELGQGPTGTCIREDRPVINDDFETNPSTWPWREPTQDHGLRASAAFPLRRGGKVIGALTFYAATSGAFTSDQVKLLQALCADVSYALDALEHERRRAEVERALRDSEQDLREADRRKTEFLGVLSHELRNPLAPIRNSIYLLEHAPEGSEQAKRARDVIRRQTEHLTRLIDDLLDVTRISRGKITLQSSTIDLRDIVRKTTDDLRSMFERASVELHVDDALGPVWIDADPARIMQVVGNLLQNAVKFTPAGGTVTVSLAVKAGYAELCVRDTGVGMEPGSVERMFEPFAQAEQSLARVQGGLGLGLALVKALVELHGGSIEARSEGLGRGAEFLVRLPSACASAEPEPARVPTDHPGGRLVLVIEDNVDAALSLADFLEVSGHRVHIASDGRSGMTLAKELIPDLILCDLGLPDVDGYEVGRRLRRDEALRATRLVALSGYAQPEDRQRSQDAGFDAHLAKPADLGELMKVLANDA